MARGLHIVVLLSVSLVFTSCRPWFGPEEKNTISKTSTPPATEWVIGEFSTLSGPQGPFGVSTHEGIQLAIEEANAAKDRKHLPVRLALRDDKGEAAGVITSVTELIEKEGAHVLIGEVASSLSLVAAGLAQDHGVPMVSPSSTHIQVTRTGNNIFRVCFTDEFQGEVLAKFARNHLKLKTAAIMYDADSDYSRGLANSFRSVYRELEGSITGAYSYHGGDQNFDTQLSEVLKRSPEILFIPAYFTEASLIFRQARKMGFTGVFIGGDGWDSGGRLFEVAGNAALGSYFSNHFSRKDQNPAAQSFVKKYRARFGKDPNALAAMGYDAAGVILEAIRHASEVSREALRSQISQTRNYVGASGVITMNASRDAVKPAVILKVKGKDQHDYVLTVNP